MSPEGEVKLPADYSYWDYFTALILVMGSAFYVGKGWPLVFQGEAAPPTIATGTYGYFILLPALTTLFLAMVGIVVKDHRHKYYSVSLAFLVVAAIAYFLQLKSGSL